MKVNWKNFSLDCQRLHIVGVDNVVTKVQGHRHIRDDCHLGWHVAEDEEGKDHSCFLKGID